MRARVSCREEIARFGGDYIITNEKMGYFFSYKSRSSTIFFFFVANEFFFLAVFLKNCWKIIFFSLFVFAFIVIVFAHPREEMVGRFGGHALALLLCWIRACKPGVKAFFGYHIIVVQAIEDIEQQSWKKGERKSLLFFQRYKINIEYSLLGCSIWCIKCCSAYKTCFSRSILASTYLLRTEHRLVNSVSFNVSWPLISSERNQKYFLKELPNWKVKIKLFKKLLLSYFKVGLTYRTFG